VSRKFPTLHLLRFSLAYSKQRHFPSRHTLYYVFGSLLMYCPSPIPSLISATSRPANECFPISIVDITAEDAEIFSVNNTRRCPFRLTKMQTTIPTVPRVAHASIAMESIVPGTLLDLVVRTVTPPIYLQRQLSTVPGTLLAWLSWAKRAKGSLEASPPVSQDLTGAHSRPYISANERTYVTTYQPTTTNMTKLEWLR
jgi:hypothetical protein